ncbi:MAG: polyprenyl synthetase family protein [Bacteroidota bacterium]|nr:polyprenyl synthetase family protein [Bacteroidota bacterium]MDX5431477.1 polyprenyl synthetase family protein [Bacteroidota bacterium]MDX5470201.1 polyprenyl synthetase family protein [Bacteroidota bacterium]
MSQQLDKIKGPIADELAVFEGKFRNSMKTSVSLLDTIMNYIVKRKGKQMRPMFVLFCSKLFGDITEKTYRGAALVELLHTATLVHDDVVDDSYKRRGFFSINALWKNKIAVLVGDYLLSKGLLLSLENDDFYELKLLSHSVRQMSEGELLQIEKTRGLNFSEDIYFEIIQKKTASLIASCCAIGASASEKASLEQIEKMRLFGEYVGIAFQIKDDLFDFGDDDIGKPTGIDIKEKKLTLPLIYALNQAESGVRKKMVRIIRKENNNDAKVREVVDFVRQSGGLTYAKGKMEEYKTKALSILSEMPDNSCRTSLEELVHYVTSRKK